MIGSRVGPYEILASVGAGGMGEVYRARDTRLGREVAVKVLPAHLVDAPDALARFEREARAVAALNHPNILALHDVGREGPVSYAVTELLEGETLRARIASGPVPPRRALDLLTQTARGLGAAHERGIVHRDIKPENLFVTTDGRVKILDFGVAMHHDNVRTADVTKTGLTEPGMLIGTPAYMAPEQLLTQTATPRSDLFAFGIVAHELLTGMHPFKRPSLGETTIAILREDPAPLGPAAASLPAGVGPLLGRCLEKQPTERPGSARDLAFFLEMLASMPDASREPPTAASSALPTARRQVLLISSVLLLFVVLLSWGYLGFTAERVASDAIERDLARAQRAVRRGQDERLTRLALSARMIAAFPALKAVLETADTATILGFLQEQQTLLPGTPTLIALRQDGRVLARTDGAGSAPAAPGDTWVEQLVTRGGEPAVVAIEGRLHHAAAMPSQAGGTIFGYIVAAVPIDHAFAQWLSESTQDEIVLLGNGVLGSTLRGSQTPWSSLQAWRESGGRTDRAQDVVVGTQRFAAREVPLSDEPAFSAIVAKSRDEAVEPFRRTQRGLMVIGLLGVAMAVAAGFWMNRSVTRAFRRGQGL